MKNRRIVIIAFVLVAALALGVGYANLSDTLTIAGQANVKTDAASAEFAADVYFKTAEATTSGDTASILTDKNRASFTVNSLSLKGQTATFTFVIANESNHDATVKVTSISIKDTISDGEDADDNDNLFKVTTDVPVVGVALAAATDPTQPQDTAGTATIVVTVELDTEPTNPITGTFDIYIDVTTND